MTEYAVTHSCGHDGTYDLIGPPDKREAEQAILSQLPCHTCRAGVPLVEPEALGGLPQSVAIADRVRQQRLTELRTEVEAQIEQARIDSRARGVARQRRLTPNIRKAVTLLQAIAAIPLAQWWVDNRTTTLVQMTQRAIRDGFLPEWFKDE